MPLWRDGEHLGTTNACAFHLWQTKMFSKDLQVIQMFKRAWGDMNSREYLSGEVPMH